MAGIGVRLNNIYGKNSLMADVVGFAYSTAITVAPMLLVILDILLMGFVLDFDSVAYLERELFSCTVLYVFVFSMLTTSPFNSVLSKYMQDVIYEERYEDILPCYYVGMFLAVCISSLLAVPFCLWEYFVGEVSLFYVFVGFCCYMLLVMVLYSMIYLSSCKEYQLISIFFMCGLAIAFLAAFILRLLLHWSVPFCMLFALTLGFFLIAVLEYVTIKRYFKKNSNRYKAVLVYFKTFWQLAATNFFYVLGLYVHNFVFWTTDMRIVVAESFVCNQPYDMATCLAMFTNISATVIFTSRVEMYFHEKYKAYSEAVIGGKGADIENAKQRMFRKLSSELLSLVRIQFIISVTIYLLCIVILPQVGFAGTILRIYPCLAAGYFILFLMYAEILFLYYFKDKTGVVATTFMFCLVTFLGSIAASHLEEIWYGTGLVVGAFVGWTIAYMRIRWMEKHLTAFVFSQGALIKQRKEEAPSSMVYCRYEEDTVSH
ncbi:exopolysaccharide Pel transporter PelG [Lachnospiraceae bacterium 50-23]|jgi:uncharacterized membrane protein|nr:exopolysaccharide Pel transporter PelG [Dorea sp.]GFI36519.1 hypothetical protein IMSAGC015_00680 [Lachnospiraceae bacterium]